LVALLLSSISIRSRPTEPSGGHKISDRKIPDASDTAPEIPTVEIAEEDFLGKTLEEVQEILFEKGLRLDAITGNYAPSDDLVSTVYQISPDGTVALDTIISVYFYAANP
jgi:hypothetical protein